MTEARVHSLPIAHIASPSLVRTTNGHDDASLQGLSSSIIEHGLLQPILVRPIIKGTDEAEQFPEPLAWIVVAGRRRLAACKLAKLETVPALVGDADQSKAYEHEAVENIQREDLSLVDTARAIRMLMMVYDDQRKVCQIVGKSPAWVSKHLTVTSGSCPPVIKDLLDREIVTDLETLLYLKSIAELEKARNVDDQGGPTWTRMLRILKAGNMTRIIARDALASLKTPKPPTQAVDVTRDGPTIEQRRIVPPSLIGIDADPKTAFTIALPIDLLGAFEDAGGAGWLETHLRASSK